jgi:lipocalin-like protein
MTEAKRLIDQLVGAWTLVEWSERRPDGGKAFPLGADAIGQIIYSADGHVAAQLARKNVHPFVSGDWRQAGPDEAASAFKDYFGYFGTFTIDVTAQSVVHHVEGSWFPNLYGVDQVRRFRIRDEVLHLDADTDWGKVVIIWKRAAAFSSAA